MDGDIAPIGEICDVAERYGAMTFSMRSARLACMARAVVELPNATASCIA
jgi:hypothetical protein